VGDKKIIQLPRKKERSGFLPDRPDWIALCILGSTGQPIPDLANTLIALRHDPLLLNCFAFDEMLRATILVSELPGKEWETRRLITDNDVSVVQEYLQLRGLPRVSQAIVSQAIDTRGTEASFHPIRNYLESLEWDGVPRLPTWLTIYLDADPSLYAAGIGTMALLSMVARVFQPGCKCDYALVLEGPQGTGKSKACQILGGDYYSDSLPDVTSGKDVSQHLAGKWLIEVAEMSALSRAEAAALKAFLTRQDERYRPPYGRKEVIEPRQCVFIGTTNKTAYLKDETGNRRFWPVKVGKIQADALADDRDKLFAEAVHFFHSGAQWWPDAAFEKQHITPQQDARFESDVWEETIADYLSAKDRVLVGEVARDCLGIQTGRTGRAEQNRITTILERIGWKRLPKDSKGNIAWGPPKPG
jgi:predicted P-loop ATPase